MSFEQRPPSVEPGSPSLEPVVPDAGALARRRPPSRSATLVNAALGFALVVAVGGTAFAVGRITAPQATAAAGRLGGAGNGFGDGAFPRASGAPRGGFGGGNGVFGGGFGGGAASLAITGTVQSVNDGVMTLTTTNGATIEVSVGSGTTYHSQAAASASDVTAGSQVSVQLDGGGRLFRGGPNASASPGPLGTASEVTILAAGSN